MATSGPFPQPTGQPKDETEQAIQDASSTPGSDLPLVDGDKDELAVEAETGPGGVVQSDENTQGDKTADIDQSEGARDYPEPQSARGAFVNEQGVDINTTADHTSRAQGNKYGRSQKAVENFLNDAERNIERLERELDKAKQDRDNLQQELSDIQSNTSDGQDQEQDDGPGSQADMDRKKEEDS